MAEKNKLPDGSWKIIFKGMRADALAEIEKAKDIPKEWREALKAEVNSYPDSVKAVKIDAHCNFSGIKKVSHHSMESIF